MTGRARGLAITALLLLAGCASTPEPAGPAPFAWLAGCWQSEDGTVRETWSAPQAGYLFGHGLTFRDGQAVFFEQLRIEPGPPPVFVASPRGQAPVSFEVVETGAGTFRAENPAHDFPQAIVYARDGAHLTAIVSRADGSGARTFACRPCR